MVEWQDRQTDRQFCCVCFVFCVLRFACACACACRGGGIWGILFGGGNGIFARRFFGGKG